MYSQKKKKKVVLRFTLFQTTVCPELIYVGEVGIQIMYFFM